jgi:kynureninase
MTPDWAAVRARYTTLDERTYFTTHCFGPLLHETLADLDEYRRSLPQRHHVIEPYYDRIVELRGLIARLIGAEPDDVALGPSATTCQGNLAAALAPSRNRDVILTTSLDFTSARYLWHAQARRGYRVVEVPARNGLAMPIDELIAAMTERVAIVAVPMVAYTNGAMLDVARLVDAAHAAGAIVVLDAYQAIGIVPIDVRALGVDVLVAGAHKWLSSASMGIAFMYVAPALAARIEPAFPGWFGHVDPLAFAPRFEPAPGGRKFEQGTPAGEAVFSARAGVRLALELGVPAMRERSLELADHLIARADALGIPLATPRARAERAGLVALAVPDPKQIASLLDAQGVDVDTRPGTGIRLSCHPGNTIADVDRAMDVLAPLVR